MGQWKHRLSNIDEESRTAQCSACGDVTIRIRQSSRQGPQRWKCNTDRDLYIKPYKKHKDNKCNRCPFIAISPVQLDIHHKDYNHKNNTPENLETICANCHRLEHFG